jgi:hypothetical protein
MYEFQLYYDRRSEGQFVLVSGPLWGRWPDFKFLWVTITFFLHHVGRPLWWEDESVICSAITHWLESHRTHNHILLSHLRLPRPGGSGPRIYIPQERGGPVILPGQAFTCTFKLKFKLYYYRRSAGQFVLASGPIDFSFLCLTITFFLHLLCAERASSVYLPSMYLTENHRISIETLIQVIRFSKIIIVYSENSKQTNKKYLWANW